MRKAVATRPTADFVRPDTVVSITIDPLTGCRAADDSPEKREEFYIIGTEPGETCVEGGEDDLKSLPVPMPPGEPGDRQSGSGATDALPRVLE